LAELVEADFFVTALRTSTSYILQDRFSVLAQDMVIRWLSLSKPTFEVHNNEWDLIAPCDCFDTLRFALGLLRQAQQSAKGTLCAPCALRSAGVLSNRLSARSVLVLRIKVAFECIIREYCPKSGGIVTPNKIYKAH